MDSTASALQPIGIPNGCSRSRSLPARPLGWVAYRSDPGNGAAAYDVWHNVCRPVFDVRPRESATNFTSAFKFCDIGGLIFNETQYSAVTFHRTARHVRRSDENHFALHLLLRGRETGWAGTHGEHSVAMAPDRIVLHDWGQAFVSVSDATHQISVAIPRELIANRNLFFRKNPVVSWTLSSAPGSLLAHALVGVWRALPALNAADAPAVAQGFLGLLNGLLAQPGGLPSGRATGELMKSWLRRHARQPGCNPDWLAREFPHSRASIYRLFQEVGGVEAYIREQRLTGSYVDLATGKLREQSIAQFARSWGYTDPGHFHRAFKKRFGLTPGDVAAMSAAAANGDPRPAGNVPGLQGSLTQLHRWFRLHR